MLTLKSCWKNTASKIKPSPFRTLNMDVILNTETNVVAEIIVFHSYQVNAQITWLCLEK